MKQLIIGLCGRAGSGKSSVARYLAERYEATVFAFAEQLKLLAMDVWGFSEEQVFGEVEIKERPDPRIGVSPRWAMQRLGQARSTHNEHIGFFLQRSSEDGVLVDLGSRQMWFDKEDLRELYPSQRESKRC